MTVTLGGPARRALALGGDGLMEIHGLRIYPQSVEVVRGRDDAPIFVHGRVSDDCSDFFYIFRTLATAWRGHFFAGSFGVGYNEDGSLEDPFPDLRERYGPGLVDAELDGQLMILRGDEFPTWGASLYAVEGAFLPVFREVPPFDLLRRVYWGHDFRLTSVTWPKGMTAVVHMWDDIYWQYFTVRRPEIDALIRAHAGDSRLKMFFVDLDREYPDPSNGELQPAVLPDGGWQG